MIERHQSVKGNGKRKEDWTIVCSQTPYSVSHNLTVESNPQLYAFVFSPVLGANTTFDTLAVCDLSTDKGAFRRGLLESSTLLLFLRSRSFKTGSGTWSEEGMDVSQKPISPSQDEVSRWVPVELDETEDTGAVWRWREARGLEVVGVVVVVVSRFMPSFGRIVNCEIWALRSWDEVAMVYDPSSSSWLDEMIHSEVIGAECRRLLDTSVLE